MTGYGQARWEGDGCVVSVEVRSVNGRYLKLVPHLPNELAKLERDIEKEVRRRVQRGTVDLFVRLEFTGARAARPVNKAALASYVRQLREAAEEEGVQVAVNAEALVALPGVLEQEDPGEEANDLGQSVVEAIDEALDGLDKMRCVEGTNLREELLAHVAIIETEATEVETRHPEGLARYAERLTERVNRLLKGTDIVVSQQDLAREIAVYAERSSVAEEAARLQSHVQQMRDALDKEGPVGRRLEFLGQEMHREVNTMGSKVNDVDLSKRIIELHGVVDKIREQVANVE